MKLLQIIVSLSLISILYSSCQSDYDFEVESESQIIVNCIFHPDSIWKVEILQSPTSLWKYDFKPNMEASVKLLVDNQILMLEPKNFDGSIYYTSTSSRIPRDYNEPIQLEVSNGNSFVSAISNIPPKPQFSWELDEYSVRKLTSNTNKERYTCGVTGKMRLRIDNDANRHLWYRISIRYRPHMQYGSSGRISGNERDTVITDNLSLFLEHPEAFKTIRMTDGYLIDLSTYNPATDELFLDLRGGVSNIPGDIDYFVIIVASVTEDFMKYSLKVMDQYVASQDIFSEPVSIPSNITGGLGIFSGINSVTDTIFIDK